MKVYFLNAYTSKGTKVLVNKPKSFSVKGAQIRKRSLEKKGYKVEIVVSPENRNSYVLSESFL